MSLVDWDPKFETGLESVDEQHRFLFKVINQHFDAMQESKGIAEMSRTLNALKSYAQFHFNEEEQLMQHHRYLRLDDHIRLHQIWVEKVAEMEQKVLEGSYLVSIEILRFMKDWITNHIEVEDRAFGTFMKNQ
jgi:hemerythrin-like metal-binding protein